MKLLSFMLSLCFILFVSSCAEQKEGGSELKPEDTQVKAAQKENPMLREMNPNWRKEYGAEDAVVGGVEWLTLDELQEVAKTDKKRVLVDVYTDWCGWCKVMDKKTFADPEVKKYLEENFHTVKFNAEQKETIVFKGKEYKWKPSGRRGINMLAVELLNGRLGYPTIVYLDEDLHKIKSVAGYKTPAQLMADIKGL